MSSRASSRSRSRSRSRSSSRSSSSTYDAHRILSTNLEEIADAVNSHPGVHPEFNSNREFSKYVRDIQRENIARLQRKRRKRDSRAKKALKKMGWSRQNKNNVVSKIKKRKASVKRFRDGVKSRRARPRPEVVDLISDSEDDRPIKLPRRRKTKR